MSSSEFDDSDSALAKDYRAHGCPLCNCHFADDPIYTCTGNQLVHNICYRCRMDHLVCPICKSRYTGNRNRRLERICAEALGLHKMEPPKMEFGPANLKHNLFSGPTQAKGKFKCRVPECNENLPICRIINHCRTFHRDIYTETSRRACTHYYTTEFTKPMKSFTEIVQLPLYGLIYISCFVTNDKKEDSIIIRAWAQLAAPEEYTKILRYDLKLRVSELYFSFCDIPHSIRASKEEILKSGHYLAAAVKLHNSMKLDFMIRTNQGAQSHRNTVTYTKLGSNYGRIPI